MNARDVRGNRIHVSILHISRQVQVGTYMYILHNLVQQWM